MRPIIVVLAVAAALLVQAPADATPPSRGEDPAHSAGATAVAPPPVTVSVYVAPHIPQTIVERLLAEASDVWRPVGVTFRWVHGPDEIAPYGRAGDDARYRPSTLRVSIDHERGDLKAEMRTALGWIRFDRPDEPDQVIHLSYDNAESLLEKSELVVGSVNTMAVLQREQFLARAMGRALAHELGHYLLASKAHTARGLMQTSRSAAELFGRQRLHFELDASQKEAAVSRLRQIPVLAMR